MALLTQSPLDEPALRQKVRSDAAGAVVSFAGVVRDHHEGQGVRGIDYEAAQPLALRALEKIEREAAERFAIEAIAIAHRVGRLEVGETSVVICVAAAHRAEAFDACRWAIDRLKETAPIWKKEERASGEHVWVPGTKLQP